MLNNNPVKAQISPDQTVNTQVNTVNNVTEITGGTEANENLFHSFQNFSLETGNTAFFNNNLAIKNIISRVTGVNISNIDGLIRANGNANLILINPNGINFGSNASLDIGGSFLGSTAESVIFADGTVFSAKDTQTNPLLTISVPLGLQVGQNPGKINVTGTGHNLSVADPLFSGIIFGEQSGIRVKPGQTLALVGGEISLNGGTVAAPGGKVELGSVAAGIVNLNFSDNNLSLGYENINSLENIELRSQSLADATGTESIPGGSIQVQGKQVNLNDGSLLLVQNRAGQEGGEINVNAAEAVTISGTNNNGTIRSSLTNETLGIGKGGDIQVTTRQLSVNQGATIVAKTLSPSTATGGNITINVIDKVEVIGSSTINPGVTSSIVAASFGAGNGGDNNITTNFLNAQTGGTIAATAFNTGNGGDIKITAKTIELVGIEPIVFAPSALTASTLGAGNAGNLTIDTATLTLLQGGRVDASTAATGNAGSITINATDFVQVSDKVVNSLNPSLIASSATIFDPTLQQLLQLPPIPSGNAGVVKINTPRLNITEGGLITTRNDGLGNSGSIKIDADSIFLNNESGITSEIGSAPNPFSGNGGSFAENLSFNNNSSPKSAQNSADTQGGGIDITTKELLIQEGANISTDTFTDRAGGNITINATENIKIQGFSTANPTKLSFISTSSFGNGNAGNLNLSTAKLTILDGSRIGAGTFGTGLGGNVNVKATELIEVIGAEPNQSVASLLGASSLGAGNAGNLTIDTAKLVVRDGGRIDSSAAATGSAGNVNIQASEGIEISGQIPGTNTPSLISSGVNIEDEISRQLFRLPSIPTGDAGSVNIATEVFNITDGAEVSVVNEGLGNAGRLQIDANSILLENQGNLSAATESGVGGNITLLADNVFLQGNSTTTATAGGDGNGGNISIDANNLVALDSSQITANANQGVGGSIQIDTKGIYYICTECQITASSRLGVDGVVNIETLEPNTELEILNVPQQPSQPQEIVAVSCPATNQANSSELTITGRGGLPASPQGTLNSESLINFDAPRSEIRQPSNSAINNTSKFPSPARGWYRDAQGTVILSAQAPNVVNNSVITTPNCHNVPIGTP
ncbi:MAG: filamentous hemagglutinin N-terminal domain-containing protein [Waterburya sp.]